MTWWFHEFPILQNSKILKNCLTNQKVIHSDWFKNSKFVNGPLNSETMFDQSLPPPHYYSAKIWMGICPLCPPAIDAPDKGALTYVVILLKWALMQWCGNREGQGGHCSPPLIFGRSVNPIPTGESRLSPPITTGTTNVFHLPASLFNGMGTY